MNLLNRFVILLLSVLVLMNFYVVPRGTIAYNTKNLVQMNIVAKK